MGISIFGGGFFYQPFQNTALYYGMLTTGEYHEFGAWAQFTASLPFPGRWVDLRSYQEQPTSEFRVQLGIGPAGSETIWQPTVSSGILGFPFSYFGLVSAISVPPIIYSFPVTVGQGVRICGRAQNAQDTSETIYCWLSIWG